MVSSGRIAPETTHETIPRWATPYTTRHYSQKDKLRALNGCKPIEPTWLIV